MAAGERTEKATPKRRDEARKRGEVARSSEVNSVAVLLAGIAALVVAGPHMLNRLEHVLAEGLGRSGDATLVERDGLGLLVAWSLREVALAVAPLVLAVVAAGLIANVAQVRFRVSVQALKPRLSNVSPKTGFKRMFGKHMLMETSKSVAKVVVVGAIAAWVLVPKLDELGALVGMQPGALVSRLGGALLDIALPTALALAVLAAADAVYQRRRHEKQLRMTKEEAKQELRQTELPPEVRAAIRRRQTALARSRMLAEVPTATVVVVNPTHVAVALRYDGSTPAPVVVAKGADYLAATIREKAEEHGVPVVHDPPLARTLLREVDLGQMIPEGLYTAVAEVLAFVFRTARRRTLPAISRQSEAGR